MGECVYILGFPFVSSHHMDTLGSVVDSYYFLCHVPSKTWCLYSRKL